MNAAVLDALFTAAQASREPLPLADAVRELAARLANTEVVALAADNGPSWIAGDLACIAAGKPLIPLPHFFTAEQVRWAVESAGVDALLTDQPSHPGWAAAGFRETGEGSAGLQLWRRDAAPALLPPGTAKITFTSGSTGQPKGVCLSQASQEAVAGSVALLMRNLQVERHLCALPLPVLLENVAGAYAALMAGARCVVPGLAEIGWQGSSQWDPRQFLRCVQEERIQSAIILPQMLKAVLPLLPQFDVSSLLMVAVGGARVAPDLLQAARTAGLPVYEGYGLSECSSVVCFNRPGEDRPGTVGKPLPHVRVRTTSDGELQVAGVQYLGYLGQPPLPAGTWLDTGDLASIDRDGFVTITGRRKHLIISSFGRNISPEWVESELLGQRGILQAAVFGEAQPHLTAVLVAPALSDAALQQAVDQANSRLPDYAQVKAVRRADEPFSAGNGLATSNGRNKRAAIAAFYSLT